MTTQTFVDNIRQEYDCKTFFVVTNSESCHRMIRQKDGLTAYLLLQWGVLGLASKASDWAAGRREIREEAEHALSR